MKKILVTGGGGLVGTELVRQLSESKECKIVSLSRSKNEAGYLTNVEFFANSDLFEGKINIREVDIVVNCAFARSNKCEDLSNGLEFSYNLLKFIKENSDAGIINVSTQGLYFQPETPTLLKETDKIEPKDCYGVTKQAVEYLMDAIFGNSSNRYTNVRLSSVNFKQRFTQYFVNACLDGNPISVYGKDQLTSLIDVYDVARGIIALIAIPGDKWQKHYNLGTGKTNTILEIADITSKVAENVFKLKVLPMKFVDREVVPFSAMDISRLTKETGWIPEVSVENMMLNMFKKTIEERKGL